MLLGVAKEKMVEKSEDVLDVLIKDEVTFLDIANIFKYGTSYLNFLKIKIRNLDKQYQYFN